MVGYQKRFARCEGQLYQSWSVGRIERHPGGDPCAEDAVLGRISLEPFATFVRDLLRRLEQHQTEIGFADVGSPRRPVSREDIEVARRVLPSQRDLKPTFPARVAMTRSKVAARLRQHRHHIVLKRHIARTNGPRRNEQPSESDGDS